MKSLKSIIIDAVANLSASHQENSALFSKPNSEVYSAPFI